MVSLGERHQLCFLYDNCMMDLYIIIQPAWITVSTNHPAISRHVDHVSKQPEGGQVRFRVFHSAQPNPDRDVRVKVLM